MTLRQLLVRFTVTYIAALIVLALVVSWLNLKAGTSINTSALLAATLYACMTFCEKNGRRLSADEVTKAWLGMLAIDLCLQILIVALMALVGLAPGLLSGPMLFALVFVGLLHAAGLYAMVKYSGWLYDKQQQAKARKAAKRTKKDEARPSRGHREPVGAAMARRPPTQEYQRTVPMELR